MIPLIGNVQNRQIHRDRKWISNCQGLGEGRRGGWMDGWMMDGWMDDMDDG